MMVENWFVFVAITWLLIAAASFYAYWKGYARAQGESRALRAENYALRLHADALAQANVEAQLDIELARMGLR